MIKIFVSSTFADMHAERDAIQMYVLPKIRKLAERVGEGFDFCDLRWGINTADQSENECMVTILETCFREIKKCKPYMIVMLGERYGSSPKIGSAALLSCMNAYSEQRYKYEDIKDRSYTDLEVLYGPLSDDEQFRRTIFLFRRPIVGAPAHYHGTNVEREKIDNLKQAIINKSRSICIRNYFDYGLDWDDTVDRACGIDRFVDLLSSKIDEVLSPILDGFAVLPEFEKINRRQWLYIDKKAKYFCGMNELVQKSESIIRDQKELFIRGAEGSGKSCLLSKLAQNKKNVGCNVLPYICNHAVEREEIFAFWIDYLSDLLRRAQCPILPPVNRQNSVWSKLDSLLKSYDSCAALPPLYFFVDGAEHIRDNCRLASPQYANIYFVYSRARSFGSPSANEILLESSQADIAAILAGNMQAYGKELPKEIRDEIIKKYGRSEPIVINLLFCRLALLDAVDFADGTNISNQKRIMHDIIAQSGTSEGEVCKSLIALIAERTDKVFIYAVVKYIASSFFGLRREDLQRLLQADGIEWKNAYYSVLVDYFDELFYEHADGRVEIDHSDLRQTLATEEVAKEYRSKILRYLKSLSVDDPFKASQIFSYCLESKDGQYLINALQNEYCHSSAFVRSMSWSVNWLQELIEDGHKLGADIRLVWFINNVFCRNVISGTMDTTTEIIRSTLKFLESYNGDKERIDFKIAEWHLQNASELFYDRDEVYARFRYIAKVEGDEFANDLYDYAIKLKLGFGNEFADEYLAFINRNENRISKLTLLYCYYVFSLYCGDGEQKALFLDRCLDIIVNATRADYAFTNVAIGVVDGLCDNKLWRGVVNQNCADAFEKYYGQIVSVAEVFDDRRFLAFYVNGCVKVAAYFADIGDTASAKKYCELVAQKLFENMLYNTNEVYDLLHRAMLGRRMAEQYRGLGDNASAAKLYGISVNAMDDYFKKYASRYAGLPEEECIIINDEWRIVHPHVIVAENCVGLAEVNFAEGNYKNCAYALNRALSDAAAFYNVTDDVCNTGEVAYPAFVLLNKLIATDRVKAEYLAEPVRTANRIGNNLRYVVLADFACDLGDFAKQITENFIKSCIRRKENKAALDFIKRYDLEYDTAILCGVNGENIDLEVQPLIAELVGNARFIEKCFKTISPKSEIDIAEKLCTAETVCVMADFIRHVAPDTAREFRTEVVDTFAKKLKKINGKTLAALSVRLPLHVMDSLIGYIRGNESVLERWHKNWSEDGISDAHGQLAVEYLGLAYDYINHKDYAAAELQCNLAAEHMRLRNKKMDKLITAIIFNIKGLCREATLAADSFGYFDLAVKAAEELRETYPNMLLIFDCLASMLYNRACCSSAPIEYDKDKRRSDLSHTIELADKLYGMTDMRYYARLSAAAKKLMPVE